MRGPYPGELRVRIHPLRRRRRGNNSDELYDSLVRFHTNLAGKDHLPTADDLRRHPYVYKGWLFEAAKLIYNIPEEKPYSKSKLVRLYEFHNVAVLEYFQHRPESLLTVNLADADAAEKIMNFLDIPYNDEIMPHHNRTT
jgi:hypothetical protein